MSNDEQSTYLDSMIANILGTQFENIPPSTVTHAKNRIIDTIGCMHLRSKSKKQKLRILWNFCH
jgi:2-methylcitrate dehydratase PrpD